MTELFAEIAIETYQRRQRQERNRKLALGMRELHTAEQFLAALRGLKGLNVAERETARAGGQSKILQTLA